MRIKEHASEVKQRLAIASQEEAASRPNDLTLEPKYRGFIPVPNTSFLIKFNAKLSVDFTDDPQNTGKNHRFVTGSDPGRA